MLDTLSEPTLGRFLSLHARAAPLSASLLADGYRPWVNGSMANHCSMPGIRTPAAVRRRALISEIIWIWD